MVNYLTESELANKITVILPFLKSRLNVHLNNKEFDTALRIFPTNM